MSQISPPIRILVVAVLAFGAAWMLFLRPKDDIAPPAATTPPANTAPVQAGGPDAQSPVGKAVEQANEAVAATDKRAAEVSGDPDPAATAPASKPAANAAARQTPAAKPADKPAKAADAGGLPVRVLEGLGERKVVVLLFWTPKAVEDEAVRKALSGIDRHDGKVMAHATNVKKIAAYEQITRGANVEQSPTVVVVDRDRQVRKLVGYVDRVTIDQLVSDALRKR